VSFPPPETRQINRAYIFGPDYNLKTITIKRKDISHLLGIALFGLAKWFFGNAYE
jgi:hypothetical protein